MDSATDRRDQRRAQRKSERSGFLQRIVMRLFGAAASEPDEPEITRRERLRAIQRLAEYAAVGKMIRVSQRTTRATQRREWKLDSTRAQRMALKPKQVWFGFDKARRARAKAA